jgi:hypothetical protein
MAKDVFHEHVKEALIKDGWTITHDPFRFKHHEKWVKIDLGAEKLIIADKGTETIAVEVKSFTAKSNMYAFHEALGQYRNYFRNLIKSNIDRVLFLAVPDDVYYDFFEHPYGIEAIEYEELKIIVFDAERKIIVKWIK